MYNLALTSKVMFDKDLIKVTKNYHDLKKPSQESFFIIVLMRIFVL